MTRYLLLVALIGGGIGCDCGSADKEKPRSLTEAREITLQLFKELDAFKLEKQTEVGLNGHSAVRMEASWKHGGQRRQGIIYVVDHPNLFNVIHYTAPSDNNIFEAGYPEFQRVVRSIKAVPFTGKLSVTMDGEDKLMRSADLQLEVRYPASWVYSLDEVNRAIVLSGPRSGATWLTTINFSVIQKWGVE